MKILITGSNGLLGQKLVKLLSDQGQSMVATAHSENRVDYLEKEFDFQIMNISDEESVRSTMIAVKPDVVINTAAMTDVDKCELEKDACTSLNVDAVKYLVKACEENDCFLMHLSTDFIFDGTSGPYAEDDEANPLSFYGESKLEAEKVIKESAIEWAIVRTVLVYGVTPGMSRSNIILWVKNSLENRKELKIVDDQWRTPTLAEDLAEGCYLIAKKKAQGVFNISGQDLLTPHDMAMKTCDYFNLDKSLITKVDASTFSQTAVRPPKTGFVLDKARNILGYAPKSFEEGIRELDRQLSLYK